jgi:acyl-CoA dehydrogenase
LEQARLVDLDDDMVDTIFEVLVRDFSAAAVALLGRAGSTPAQQEWATDAIRKPVVDQARFDRVWSEVEGLADAYTMTP